jgi:hypothetical protein
VRLHTLTRWPRYAFPTPCAQQPPTPQILPFFLLVKDAPKPNPIKCGVMYGVWYIGTHKNIWCSHHQDLQRLKSVTFYLTDLLLSTKVGRQMARLSVASNVSFSPLKCKKGCFSICFTEVYFLQVLVACAASLPRTRKGSPLAPWLLPLPSHHI